MNLKDRYFLYYNLIQHHLHLKHYRDHDVQTLQQNLPIDNSDKFITRNMIS